MVYTRKSKAAKRMTRAIETVQHLENWPAFLVNRLRSKMGSPPSNDALKLRNGLSFELHPGSHGLYSVFMEVFYSSVYDRHPLFRIGTTDIVIDIGANAGFFTLKAASLARKGWVYAYEPCSFHFDLLMANVRRNGFNNISVFKEAIYSSVGQLELRYSYGDEPTQTSIYDIGGDEKETVDTVTIKEIFVRNKIEVCHFLKMDCEGAEYDSLYYTPATVLQSIRRMAIEWHRFDDSHVPDKLAQFLLGKGFLLLEPNVWNGNTGYLYAYRPQ